MIRLAFDVRLAQGTFTLDVADDAEVEVLGVYGPSGSGKTSLLEVIAGLRGAGAGVSSSVGGEVLADTARGMHLPPHRRHVGYVPQDGALFPHLDVRRNVMYGSDSRLPPPDSRLDSAHIAPRSTSRSSWSGAWATCRAASVSGWPSRGRWCRRRGSCCWTSRSAGIDRGRKDRILPYLLRIRRELHVPMIYVTHDTRELVDIADRVLRLDDGRPGGRRGARDGAAPLEAGAKEKREKAVRSEKSGDAAADARL